MRDSFTIYRTTMEALEALPPDIVKNIVLYVGRYSMDDIEPDGSDPIAYAFFCQIRAMIDKSKKKAEAGKSGGEAKRSKPEANQKQTEAHAKQTEANCKQTEANTKQNDPINKKEENRNKKIENINNNIVRFIPPTHEQIEEYAKEQGYSFDIDRFIDFYASKGWMVGKNKMKDWKASVRNWVRGQRQGQAAEGNRQGKTADLNQRPYDYSELEKELLRRQAGIV